MFTYAGRAPRGAEINEHDVASQLAQVDLTTVGGCETKIDRLFQKLKPSEFLFGFARDFWKLFRIQGGQFFKQSLLVSWLAGEPGSIGEHLLWLFAFRECLAKRCDGSQQLGDGFVRLGFV